MSAIARWDLQSGSIPIVGAIGGAFTVLFRALVRVMGAFYCVSIVSGAFQLRFVTRDRYLVESYGKYVRARRSNSRVAIIYGYVLSGVRILRCEFSKFLRSIAIEGLVTRTNARAWVLHDFLSHVRKAYGVTGTYVIIGRYNCAVLSEVGMYDVYEGLYLL